MTEFVKRVATIIVLVSILALLFFMVQTPL